MNCIIKQFCQLLAITWQIFPDNHFDPPGITTYIKFNNTLYTSLCQARCNFSVIIADLLLSKRNLIVIALFLNSRQNVVYCNHSKENEPKNSKRKGPQNMKRYELSIMNTIIAGILVCGILAASIAACYSISSVRRNAPRSEAQVLEI